MSENGLNLIYENSIRLLHDAELLLENGRYPTATTIAILAIEEAGKFIIKRQKLAFNISNTEKYRITHKRKHSPLGEFYWEWGVYEVFTQEFEKFKLFLEENKNDDLYKQIQNKSGGEAVEFMKAIMFETPEEVENYVRTNFRYKEKLNLIEDADSGEIERIRQSGIYLDIDEHYNPLNIPANIDKGQASEWVEQARVTISYMGMWKSILKKNKPNKAIQPGQPPSSAAS